MLDSLNNGTSSELPNQSLSIESRIILAAFDTVRFGGTVLLSEFTVCCFYDSVETL